mmetsp:Transcript_42917/g.118686  ORF Transcript_42917/g.118686 Transcript_42917/m.118686 type:complete len:248 (+) Transcript_42917:654-1397(+)
MDIPHAPNRLVHLVDAVVHMSVAGVHGIGPRPHSLQTDIKRLELRTHLMGVANQLIDAIAHVGQPQHDLAAIRRVAFASPAEAGLGNQGQSGSFVRLEILQRGDPRAERIEILVVMLELLAHAILKPRELEGNCFCGDLAGASGNLRGRRELRQLLLDGANFFPELILELAPPLPRLLRHVVDVPNLRIELLRKGLARPGHLRHETLKPAVLCIHRRHLRLHPRQSSIPHAVPLSLHMLDPVTEALL